MATLSSTERNGFRKDLNISVALGGGGAKGNAHIGVLRYLEQQGFHIRAIAGSSFGGLVACFYAAGFSPDDIERLFADVDQSKVYKSDKKQSASLYGFAHVEQFLQDRLGELQFEDLQMPCAVTAVDLRTANEVIIRGGMVRQAIMTTIAMPGVFPSLLSGELELIDGGLLNPVPVALARSLAPSLPVVAVALNEPLGAPIRSRPVPFFSGLPKPLAASLSRTRFGRAMDVFMRSAEAGGREIAELRLQAERPEVVIRPKVSDVGVLQRVDVGRVAKLGEEAASLALPELLRVTTWRAGLGRRVFQRPTWNERQDGSTALELR